MTSLDACVAEIRARKPLVFRVFESLKINNETVIDRLSMSSEDGKALVLSCLFLKEEDLSQDLYDALPPLGTNHGVTQGAKWPQ